MAITLLIGKHGDDFDLSHLVESLTIEKHGTNKTVLIRLKREHCAPDCSAQRHLKALEKSVNCDITTPITGHASGHAITPRR